MSSPASVRRVRRRRSVAWGSRLLVPAAVLLVVAGAACDPPSEDPQAEEEATWVYSVLPTGDATAGRQVFVDYNCFACHAVAGDAEMPSPVSSHPGPELGPVLATRSQGNLVSSIVVPSHAIVDEERFAEDGLSFMGDFTEVMTVRQLVDLVAYVRSLAEPQ